MLKYKLREKGIDEDLVEGLINEMILPKKEIELATRVLERIKHKFADLEDKEFHSKVYVFLQRKGFSGKIIKEAIERYEQKKISDRGY